MNASAIEFPVEELSLADRKERGVELAAFDRVYLTSDPRKDLGTIVTDEGGSRYFVQWDNGRTWIYASDQLTVIL